LYLDQNYGHSIVGAYASTRYQGVFAMGDAYKLPADGTSTGNLYGIAWSHPNAGGVAGNLSDHGALFLINGGFAAAISSSIRCSADMRTPIYYDSNNTGYYTDPASTSVLNVLTLGGRSTTNAMYYQGFTLDANTMDHNATGFTYAVNAPAVGPIVRFSTGGGYDLWLNAPYNGGGNTLYFRTRNGDAGSINSWKALASYGINYADSLFATIFYDSNDTGYYCDPNSNSKFNRLLCGPYAASTSSGDVVPLSVMNNGGTGDSNVAAMSFHCQGTFGLHMHLRADSYFGIGGWSASTWRWYVQTSTGDMTAAGNVTAYSDIRLKENIKPLENCVTKIMKLNGVSFNWKNLPDIVGNPGKKDYGIIAQEVEKVFPEVIHESAHESPDGDKYKTVAYDKLVPVLLEAIKEQQNDINNLKQQIKELKSL